MILQIILQLFFANFHIICVKLYNHLIFSELSQPIILQMLQSFYATFTYLLHVACIATCELAFAAVLSLHSIQPDVFAPIRYNMSHLTIL